MSDYPETTLEQFQEAALGHVEGHKTGVTMVWKGLPRRDRSTARFWMQDQLKETRRKLGLARLHLNAPKAQEYDRQTDIWKDLLDRLSIWSAR
jgi:hypothetical protein